MATTNDAISRQGVYDATILKVTSAEDRLQTRMTSLMAPGSEISQGDLLGLQYEMQSYLMVFNVASTIQKELNEMIKTITSKI
jgi:hypothetical protein